MSQPPYSPDGQPEPNQPGGYQPPSYPPAQPTSGGSYQAGTYGAPVPPQPPGGYDPAYQSPPPPQGQGGYPPQYASAPPPKKGGALKIVLIVIGVVVLLCIGGGVLLFAQGKKAVDSVVAAAKISVVEPTTLGGRGKVTDPELQGSVQSLDAEMKKIKGTTSSVGAIYGDPEKQDLVIIAAASTLTGTQQSRFDEFTKGLSTGGFSTTNLADTAPGPLGGLAKCGDSSAAGVPTAVCVWSDAGSVGMVAMFFKKKADLEKEFISMRSEIEQKA